MENEIDPLTAPIEQVIGVQPEPVVAQAASGDEPFEAPATPAEFAGQVEYGSGGSAPVPPIEEASKGSTRVDAPPKGGACECSRWEVVNPATGAVERETGCTSVCRTSGGRFAPGHDARFKSMLIWAGERDFRMREKGTDTLRRPTTAAGRVSTRLARQVEEGIKRRKR